MTSKAFIYAPFCGFEPWIGAFSLYQTRNEHRYNHAEIDTI